MRQYRSKYNTVYIAAILFGLTGLIIMEFSASAWLVFLFVAVFFVLIIWAWNIRSAAEKRLISEVLKQKGYQPVAIYKRKNFWAKRGWGSYGVCYTAPDGSVFDTHCTYDFQEESIYWSESPKDLNLQADSSLNKALPESNLKTEPSLSAEDLLLNQLISPHKGERLAAIAAISEQAEPDAMVLQRLETAAVADPNPAVRQAAHDLLSR